MIKEFKEFAMKGNMLDMAIGIVLGAAFGTVMKSFVADLIMPIVSSVFGTPDFSNLFTVLRNPAEMTGVNMASLEAVREAGGVALGYGNFINNMLAFFLVAMALFFVVKGVNKAKAAEEAAPAAPAAPAADIVLLGEIRDLLKK